MVAAGYQGAFQGTLDLKEIPSKERHHFNLTVISGIIHSFNSDCFKIYKNHLHFQ